MTDATSLPTSQWEKLLPPSSDHSATVRYHLYWDTMAIRKIHDATDEPGILDILIVPVPIPPSVYTPAQTLLLAAANIPRPPDPDAPPPPGATQIQLSLYTATLAYHKIIYDRYKKLQDAKSQLKDRMIDSLDHTTLDLIIPDRADFNTITFYELYFRIKDHFQSITPAHLQALESDIKAPFTFSTPNSYDVHVAKHIHLNRGLVAAARTRSEIDKANDLRLSLMSSPHAPTFTTYLSIYDSTHLTLLSQSFDDMQRTYSAAVPALLTSLAATSASINYGANGAKDKAPPKKDRPTKPNAFCWTHGTTYHPSNKCRNKATGHQDRATAANKMGGKE